jgi:hypothetical protein
METITATIMKISKTPSKFKGSFYWIFFKSNNGKSYRMPVQSIFRNWRLWKPFCENPEGAIGVICEGLREKSPDILDADYLTKSRIADKLNAEVK